MQIRSLNLPNVGVKGIRGLKAEAYAFRPDVIERISAFFGEELTPGKETEIVVQTDLPPNANILSIQATLRVSDSTADPAPEEASVGIQKNQEAENTYQVKTTPAARPRNVQVRLAEGDSIWSFGGVLVESSYQMPDFATQANAYLDRAKSENGKMPLRFLIKSDSPGRASIQIDQSSLKYRQIQTQHWINDLDQTVRLDRNLNLEFSSVERIPLDRIADARNPALLKITMDIGGELGPERVFGQPAIAGKDYATVGNEYSIAQRLVLKNSIRCVGLTLFLISDSAEIYTEIQPEEKGFPAASAPMSKGNLKLNLDPNTKSGRWNYVSMDQPVELSADTPYWIIMKGIRGKSFLGLTSQNENSTNPVLVNRGGSLWRALASDFDPASLVSPVYLPGADNQTAAVEISIEGSQIKESIDPGKEVRSISLVTEGVSVAQPVLTIRSHARGVLSIANVIQEYGAS